MTDERPVPDSIERILLDQETIAARVRELAAQISADYTKADDLVLVGVLKGAFIFMADLARNLTVPHHVDFIALSSYNKGTTSTGAVRLIMDTRASVTGRNVLVVEDILDTGYTLDYLFLAEDEFAAGIARGEFLEHALVHGHRYGTPRENVERILERGESCLLNVDVQGAAQRMRPQLRPGLCGHGGAVGLGHGCCAPVALRSSAMASARTRSSVASALVTSPVSRM